jgi:hypothetical protein
METAITIVNRRKRRAKGLLSTAIIQLAIATETKKTPNFSQVGDVTIPLYPHSDSAVKFLYKKP